MAAKRSHSDRSLKSRCKVLQEITKEKPQKDLVEKYPIPINGLLLKEKTLKKSLECQIFKLQMDG